MLTFARNPKFTQLTTTSSPVRPNRTHSRPVHETSSTLHSPRSVGNLASQKSLQSNVAEFSARSNTAGSPGLGHDFSQVSVFPQPTVPAPERRQVGVGQNDAGSVPEVSPLAEGAPPATVAEGPEAEAPAAEEGSTPEASCTITSRTAVHAPDRTPDTRTTIGVCETVGFSVGGQAVDWSANTGWPSARNGLANFNWAAPELPGTSTITATERATGNTCSLDMTVVAPAGVRLRNVNELAYAAGTAGAGMELTVHVRPRSVNFGWIAIREDSGNASRISGYFNDFAAADLRHNAAPDFRRMGWDNSLAPNEAGETQGDTAATVAGTLPAPWRDGSFQWIIPTRYRCSNSTGNGHLLTHVRQRFTIEGDGTVIVTKHAASVERTP